MLRILQGCIAGLIFCSVISQASEPPVKDSIVYDEDVLNQGSQIYLDRCSLCHGNAGMGSGLVPLVLKDYPSTSLMEPQFGTDEESVRNTVIWGGTKGDMSSLSPAWGGELSTEEINAVVSFVIYLRNDIEGSLKKLELVKQSQPPNTKTGKHIFHTRCALCHGTTGEGDGKMAKIIKDPPPFDLTKSVMPNDYLRIIVSDGGEPIGRSPQMPPWKDELTSSELDSVLMYITTLSN